MDLHVINIFQSKNTQIYIFKDISVNLSILAQKQKHRLTLTFLFIFYIFNFENKNNRTVENETQAIEEVQRLWKIILAQCDSQFKQQNLARIQQFQEYLESAIKQRTKQESKMNQSQINLVVQDIVKRKKTKFKDASKRLSKMCQLIKEFYNKFGIRIILFVDQINEIASIFRQTKAALKKLDIKQFSALSIQDQQNYLKGRVNDDLRMVLNKLSDQFFYNSPVDLENFYRYQEDGEDQIQSQSGINLRMIYGTTHKVRRARSLKYEKLIEEKLLSGSMEQMFWFEAYRKIKFPHDFHNNKYGKKIQQIVQKWFHQRSYLFYIQPLLIKQGFDEVRFGEIPANINEIQKYLKTISNIPNNAKSSTSDQDIVKGTQDITKYYNDLSNIYGVKTEYKTISQGYKQIVTAYQKRGDNQKIAQSYKEIAKAYEQSGIQNNKEIIEEFYNIAQSYTRQNQTDGITKRCFENIAKVYQVLADESLRDIQKQLLMSFQQLQDVIVTQIKQLLKKFMEKRDEDPQIFKVFKNQSDFSIFFEVILIYLQQIRKQKKQDKQLFAIDLSKTNIFQELFNEGKYLSDKSVKKIICNELFYCKNLVLKSYIGDTILCKALQKLFDQEKHRKSIFQDTHLKMSLYKLSKSMQGHTYERMVIDEFQDCRKVQFVYKQDQKTTQIQYKSFILNQSPKWYKPFKPENSSKNQIYSLKQKFYQIIQNQFSQSLKQIALYDFCLPSISPLENFDYNINQNQGGDSQAADLIFIGKWSTRNFQINFIEITIRDDTNNKLIKNKQHEKKCLGITKFANFLTKIEQFYVDKLDLKRLLKIPNSFNVKINFFIVGAIASEQLFFTKEQILNQVKIENKQKLRIFKQNFQKYNATKYPADHAPLAPITHILTQFITLLKGTHLLAHARPIFIVNRSFMLQNRVCILYQIYSIISLTQ